MHGPQILARYLEVPTKEPDKYGNYWQYNSQSDRHSKVGCWGVALDLLSTSALLRRHAAEGKVVLGVNHPMRDFGTGKLKKLDLVVARPLGPSRGRESFKWLAEKNEVPLDAAERALLDLLPDIPVGPVGAVLIALEAKAVMTAHVKAMPRFYDELNSSHECVHGASAQALAIGYVQVNAAEAFASSVTNRYPLTAMPLQVTHHRQPADVLRVLETVASLPRRSRPPDKGFDGVGVTVLDFANTGGRVKVVTDPPAPQPGDQFNYDGMIVRMANEYDSRFHGI